MYSCLLFFFFGDKFVSGLNDCVNIVKLETRNGSRLGGAARSHGISSPYEEGDHWNRWHMSTSLPGSGEWQGLLTCGYFPTRR